MLAMKRVLCHQDLVSVYVFDEVDTGVGGRAADSIGRKIQRVASHGRQALAITHLAPIAARADSHLQVHKDTINGRTVSHIRPLGLPERQEEIARMIDGGKITQATRQAARAMLRRCHAKPARATRAARAAP